MPQMGSQGLATNDGDPLIGTQTAEGWWYKARIGTLPQLPTEGPLTVPPEGTYLLCKGEGRKVDYKDAKLGVGGAAKLESQL